jgi:hypothetical protein
VNNVPEEGRQKICRNLLEVLQENRLIRLDMPDRKFSVVLEYIPMLDQEVKHRATTNISSTDLTNSLSPHQPKPTHFSQPTDLTSSIQADKISNSDARPETGEADSTLLKQNPITTSEFASPINRSYSEKIFDFLKVYFREEEALKQLHEKLDKKFYDIGGVESVDQQFVRVLAGYLKNGKLRKLVSDIELLQMNLNEHQPDTVEELALKLAHRYDGKSLLPPTRVFISYSWASADNCRLVSNLSKILKENGVDCTIDDHVMSPSARWDSWMREQIQTADFTLIVCTKEYRQEWEEEDAQLAQGRGANFESRIMRNVLYKNKGTNHRFIPIFFSKEDTTCVPEDLSGYTSFLVGKELNLDEDKIFAKLYYLLTLQTWEEEISIGRVKKVRHS